MQRFDFYFRQKVTEAELDAAFDGVENAINNAVGDSGLVGVTQGAQVTEHSPTPNLSVDVTGPMVAYDQQGQRIYLAALQNPTLATDENSSATAVASGGNEKWLSLFLKYDRVLSDPRLDGDNQTVFYNRAESASIRVVQGAEAPVGTASRPALRSDQILIADVKIVFGTTQVFNADIDVTRLQTAFDISGSPKAFKARNAELAVQELENQINDIVNGVLSLPATAVTYAGSGNNWADGSGVTAANAEEAIDEVVSDLGGGSGAARIGVTPAGNIASADVQAALEELDSDLAALYAAGGAALIGFTPVGTIAASDVQAAIAELDSDLTGSGGAALIGFSPVGAIAAANVQAAIAELDTEKARLSGTNSYTGQQSVSGGGIDVTGEYTYDAPKARTKYLDLLRFYSGDTWTHRTVGGDGINPQPTGDYIWITPAALADNRIQFPLELPNGAQVTLVSVALELMDGDEFGPGGNFSVGARVSFRRVKENNDFSSNVLPSVAATDGARSPTAASAAGSPDTGKHEVTVVPDGSTENGIVDPDVRRFSVVVVTGTCSSPGGVRIHRIKVDYTEPGPLNHWQ